MCVCVREREEGREGERDKCVHVRKGGSGNERGREGGRESCSPSSVPQKKGDIRTPTIGEARLVNQFGNNGVILRNITYHSMSWRCLLIYREKGRER